MLPTTGLIAVFLLFLAGPYHTLQGKWPQYWGHRLSTNAHSNVNVLAAVAVFVHVALKFDQLGPGGPLGCYRLLYPDRRQWPLRHSHRYRTWCQGALDETTGCIRVCVLRQPAPTPCAEASWLANIVCDSHWVGHVAMAVKSPREGQSDQLALLSLR